MAARTEGDPAHESHSASRPRHRCCTLWPECPQPSASFGRPGDPPAGTPCPATSEEENAALVRRYLEEAYNGRNPAVAHELLADHFVRHSVASPHRDQTHGNADDVARVEEWLTAFPDLHISIEKLIATEDTVVVWNIWRGTQDGPLLQWMRR